MKNSTATGRVHRNALKSKKVQKFPPKNRTRFINESCRTRFVKTPIWITCRSSPPYLNLVDFRKLAPNVSKSDPKSSQNHPTFQNPRHDDGFRMSYPSVVSFLLSQRTLKKISNSKTRPNFEISAQRRISTASYVTDGSVFYYINNTH